MGTGSGKGKAEMPRSDLANYCKNLSSGADFGAGVSGYRELANGGSSWQGLLARRAYKASAPALRQDVVGGFSLVVVCAIA